MHTKDDTAYATLTDVKNKTGDVFALADEFGEVTITSYNKSKYIIKRIIVSKISAGPAVAISETIAEVAEAETPEVVPESTENIPEPVTVETVAEVPQVSESVQAIQPEELPGPENSVDPETGSGEAEAQPDVAPAIPEPESPAAETPTLAPVAEQAEPEPTPALSAVTAPVIEPAAEATPVPEIPSATVETPTIEIFESKGTDIKPPATAPSHDIVGIFAGIGLDSFWDRGNRREQAWVKDTHKLF